MGGQEVNSATEIVLKVPCNSQSFVCFVFFFPTPVARVGGGSSSQAHKKTPENRTFSPRFMALCGLSAKTSNPGVTVADLGEVSAPFGTSHVFSEKQLTEKR